MTLGGVVLAAGEGRRFGGPKQLAELDGRPLLEHVVQTMVAACDRVVVVLGARADEIRGAVDLHGAEPIVCPDWPAGIYASLRCGLAALGDEPDAVVVALGDQPALTRERIDAVLAAGLPLARATDGGIPSHPVVIRRAALASLTHPALRAATAVELGPLADVDTPDDLKQLRE